MIIVTGGAGFIGSNLVRALAGAGATVGVVDVLADGPGRANLEGVTLAEWLDRDDFLAVCARGDGLLDRVEAVCHLGACTSTVARDGAYVLRNNVEYATVLLAACAARRIPVVYASSASVYGVGRVAREEPACERPVNLYARSKLRLDEHVRRLLRATPAPIVGLRPFNVYGPGEGHKGSMASIVLQLYRQLTAGGVARLFAGTDGFADGEQRRDFVHVDDVVAVVRWFLQRGGPAGLYNVGTGRARSFNDVARAVIRHLGRGAITYVPMPAALGGQYQSFTEADLGRLRAAGYTGAFRDVDEGVGAYVAWLTGRGRASSPATA